MEPLEALKAHIRDNYDTQAAFAREVGITHVSLCRYFRKSRRPNEAVRRRIFEKTGIDLCALEPEAAS